MQVVKLIQLGDIHYPDRERLVDHKDDAFPKWLVDGVSPDVLQEGIRTILDIKERDADIVGLLVAGDLTSRGDLAAYGECVKYLTKALRLTDPKVWPEGSIHVVPGNHDVNRAAASSSADDHGAKFRPLEDAWSGAGLPILAANAVRHTAVGRGACKLCLLSINSCWGCQEKRYLPAALRAEIHAILERTAECTDKESSAIVWEQMDTPAFLHAHINDAIRALETLPENTLPVVLSHHNILPQATPRIELYTDLVNGGLVRSRLTHARTPVLYCHAHIHQDAVEVVRTPFLGEGPLVAISAPPLQPRHDQPHSGATYFQAGFNVIEVSFTDDGFPLGCRIIPYRFHPDGALRLVDRELCPIQLHSASAYLKIANQHLIDLIRQLNDQSFIRFPTLLDGFEKLAGATGQGPRFADLLREAEWFDLLQIVSRDEPCRFWQIKRRMP